MTTMSEQQALRRYLFEYQVKDASGCQIFYVDAASLAEAEALIQKGGDFYSQEVEVLDLGEPEHAGETTVDDFGDSRPSLSAPPQEVGTADNAVIAQALRYFAVSTEWPKPMRERAKLLAGAFKEQSA